ncbi:putative cytochrome c oxidase assembly protein [Botryosphaeria dothidea]|uniref:Cytochrome c oxidase assembly protein n=1 Tax=Botryosphaeria dothidea TaxID=55169 RepID=A0A8H4NAW3_9PEZI|nr:putative cytochrome c oxidase assembly protein [Botryosphaeria dothidea]
MPSSCKDIRAALAECLQNSDCIMVYRNSPSDCLRPPLSDTLPTRCQQLKKGYGECKRGMVDMRKRFRGNKPVGLSNELDVENDKKGGQLYAGKPLFDAVKGTDGDEDTKGGAGGDGR